jgi:DNA-binding MarR family transcriptional regulator
LGQTASRTARSTAIRRTRSTSDKRVADLRLTDHGRDAFHTAQRLAGVAADDLFGSFTHTELEPLETLLTKFVDPTEHDI